MYNAKQVQRTRYKASDVHTNDPDVLEEADPKKGTGKKPKGSGRRLYTDEDQKENIDPKSQKKHKGKSAPFGSAYEHVALLDIVSVECTGYFVGKEASAIIAAVVCPLGVIHVDFLVLGAFKPVPVRFDIGDAVHHIFRVWLL